MYQNRLLYTSSELQKISCFFTIWLKLFLWRHHFFQTNKTKFFQDGDTTEISLDGEKIADVEKNISTFETEMNEMYDYQIHPEFVNDS